MKRRNRMICFRVSDQEFDSFHEYCQAHGASSVSDLFRTAVHHLLDTEATGGAAGTGRLEVRIRTLEREVQRLTELAAPNLEVHSSSRGVSAACGGRNTQPEIGPGNRTVI